MVYNYSSVARATELSEAVTGSATVLKVASVAGLPSAPFTVVVDVATESEEIVTVTLVAGLNLTVTRGQDGTAAVPHQVGAVVRHMATAADFRRFEAHNDATSNVHGVGAGSSVVGTATAQTLTNKTLSGSSNTFSNVPGAALVAASVTATQLGTGAAQTAKISDLAVTTAKLADLGVTEAKLANLGVTNGKLANLAVSTAKLADVGVTTAKLADASVTDAKVASGLSASKITTGTMAWERLGGASPVASWGTAGTGFVASEPGLGSVCYRWGPFAMIVLRLRRFQAPITFDAKGAVNDPVVYTVEPAYTPPTWVSGVVTYRDETTSGTYGGVARLMSNGEVQIVSGCPNTAIKQYGSGAEGEYSVAITFPPYLLV